MSIFSGLGRGIGAAAVGYGQGQLRGEAEGVRRQQVDEQNEIRKEQLAQQRQKLKAQSKEPTLEMKAAAALYEKWNGKRYDPEFLDYLHKHPEVREAFGRGMNHVKTAMVHGGLDESQLDVFGKIQGGGGQPPSPGGSPGGSLFAGGAFGGGDKPQFAGGAFAPKPKLPPGLAPGQTLFDAEGQQPPLPADPLSMLAAQQSPNYEPMAGIGGMPSKPIGAGPPVTGYGNGPFIGPPRPGPRSSPPSVSAEPAPVPVAAPPAPEPEFDPQARWKQLAQQGPPSDKLVKGDYESDKAFLARKQKEDKGWNDELNRLATGAAAFGRAGLANEDLKTRGESNRTKIDVGKSTTALNTQKVVESKELLPGKKSNFASMFAKRANDTKQRTRSLNQTEKANAWRKDVAWYNAQTQRAAQEGRAPYIEAMIEKTTALIEGSDDANQRALLGYHLDKMKSSRPMLNDPTFNATEVMESAKAADAIAAQLAKPKAKTTVTTTTTTGTRAKAGGGAAGGGGKQTRDYWARAAKGAKLGPEDTKAYLKSKGF